MSCIITHDNIQLVSLNLGHKRKFEDKIQRAVILRGQRCLRKTTQVTASIGSSTDTSTLLSASFYQATSGLAKMSQWTVIHSSIRGPSFTPRFLEDRKSHRGQPK